MKHRNKEVANDEEDHSYDGMIVGRKIYGMQRKMKGGEKRPRTWSDGNK